MGVHHHGLTKWNRTVPAATRISTIATPIPHPSLLPRAKYMSSKTLIFLCIYSSFFPVTPSRIGMFLDEILPRGCAITNMNVKRRLPGHDLTRLGFASEISSTNPQEESTTRQLLGDIFGVVLVDEFRYPDADVVPVKAGPLQLVDRSLEGSFVLKLADRFACRYGPSPFRPFLSSPYWSVHPCRRHVG